MNKFFPLLVFVVFVVGMLTYALPPEYAQIRGLLWSVLAGWAGGKALAELLWG